MCADSEFQMDGAKAENAHEVKLQVMPDKLTRRFMLERKAPDGRQ